MNKERQYAKIVRDASRDKQDLLTYAGELMISLDGVDMNTVDLSPLAEMITHVRALDWARHSLIALIAKGNDLDKAQALLPTVTELARAYKRAVSGVNAILSK